MVAASAASLVAAQCLAGAAGPTDSVDRVTVLEQKLDRSLELIEKLAARVQELEAERAAVASASQTQSAQTTPAAPTQAAQSTEPAALAESAPQTQKRLESVEQQLAQLEDTNAAGSGIAGMPVHGFADIGIGNHTANSRRFRGANIGTFDLFLNPTLGEHTRALFDLTFEVNGLGAIEADLERAQIGYQWSDAATLWIGRFHTPFGYYNTAFHHGQQIAVSLRRPRFLLFEDQGGVMPNHTVGAWLTGREHVFDGKVTYDVFVGNGQRLDTGGQPLDTGTIDPQSGGVLHGGAIYGGNLGYLFGEALTGLKVGVSGFRSNISSGNDPEAGPITRVDNTGVYVVYDTDRFEHLAEFYRFSDTDLTNGGIARHSNLGFLQLAWRLSFATPYARYERAVLDQRDSYFALQSNGMSYVRTAAGLRFDLDAKSSLKFELGRTKNTDQGIAADRVIGPDQVIGIDRMIDQWTDVMVDYAIRF